MNDDINSNEETEESSYGRALRQMVYPIAPQKSTLEKIIDVKQLIFEHLNISIHDMEPSLFGEYTAKSDDGHDVNIYLSGFGDVCFSFENIITLDNGIVSSALKSPIIQTMLNDVNQYLGITESFRLTNDHIEYLPVLPNVKPWLVFKYIKETNSITIQVSFKISLRTTGEAYYLTTKQTAIQHFYDPSGFNCIYSITGESITNDIQHYKERMMNVWELTKDCQEIDYKRLGLLSDMISI